jgi:hypothetical protein
MVLPQRSKLSIADLRNPTRFTKFDYIDLLYRVMLQREPDPAGLQSYSRRTDIENFFVEFLTSTEFIDTAQNTAYFGGGPDRKRILLFGAYGNGNLGDSIQAKSLLHAIRTIRKDVEVWACSAMPCQYPYPYQYVLHRRQIYNLSLLHRFDLLLIGGGGLLTHPHDPLTDESWQRSIDVPVALFGIGAGGDVAAQCNTLIAKAFYVSGRDELSVTELRRFRGDIHFVPDPVLTDSSYYFISAEVRRRAASRIKKLWIIKNSSLARDSTILASVNPLQDQICFIEPSLDFPLTLPFPTAQPVYFIDDLLSLIDQVDLVISMRYHGCILGMLRDKPIVGLFEQKSSDLLARYGLQQFFVDSETSMARVPDISMYPRPQDKILRDRKIFHEELSHVLSILD